MFGLMNKNLFLKAAEGLKQYRIFAIASILFSKSVLLTYFGAALY
jgi:hypothetical protein